MSLVMSGMELFDRQVVDTDKLDSLVDEILRAIGREVGIVPNELFLRQQRRVTCTKKNSRLTFEIMFLEIARTDSAEFI